jgi:multidrug efflux system membrane fusion protein
MAQLKNAEAQQARSADLLKQGLVAQATHDGLVATSEALGATVAADRAAAESLQRQLTDTRITAPMAGRTGAILAHPGTLVTANGAAALVVINQISPVSVSFAVPARLLGDLRSAGSTRRLRAEAALAGDAKSSVVGEVNFVDNTVDPSTDTIRLKATFPNRDQRLWPGAFVEVTLNLSTRPAAVVVPTAAIQASQQGQMVYVVKAGNTAEARPVVVAWTEGNEAVIDRGLTAGETVVTDGQLRLTPGARVSAAAPPAAAAAAETGTTR